MFGRVNSVQIYLFLGGRILHIIQSDFSPCSRCLVSSAWLLALIAVLLSYVAAVVMSTCA